MIQYRSSHLPEKPSGHCSFPQLFQEVYLQHASQCSYTILYVCISLNHMQITTTAPQHNILATRCQALLLVYAILLNTQQVATSVSVCAAVWRDD